MNDLFPIRVLINNSMFPVSCIISDFDLNFDDVVSLSLTCKRLFYYLNDYYKFNFKRKFNFKFDNSNWITAWNTLENNKLVPEIINLIDFQLTNDVLFISLSNKITIQKKRNEDYEIHPSLKFNTISQTDLLLMLKQGFYPCSFTKFQETMDLLLNFKIFDFHKKYKINKYNENSTSHRESLDDQLQILRNVKRIWMHSENPDSISKIHVLENPLIKMKNFMNVVRIVKSSDHEQLQYCIADSTVIINEFYFTMQDVTRDIFVKICDFSKINKSWDQIHTLIKNNKFTEEEISFEL